MSSVLGIDLMFELGPLFVLVTTYENTILENSTRGSSPSMIGPMMLCMWNNKETYATLFQKMVTRRPGLRVHLRSYGTDSEVAIRDAAAQEFPAALGLLCKRHFEQNIASKCSDLKLSQELTTVIYNDTFGPESLIYSESIYFLYKTKVASLQEKWNALEQAEKTRPPEFASYFKCHKMDDLFNHLLIKRSTDAGYGDKPYYNNVSESLNAVIKRWQGFNMSQMDLFIKDMKELVMKQKSDVERAFLGLPGPYKVKPQFSGRVVPFMDFAEKQKLKRSFHSVAVCSTMLRKVQDFKPIQQEKSVQQRNFSQEEEISEERLSDSS